MSEAIGPVLFKELDSLLDNYSELALSPSRAGSILIVGQVSVGTEIPGGQLQESFDVKISVPLSFPAEMPSFAEVGGRIPSAYHHLSEDSLCLGAPLRLKEVVRAGGLLGLVNQCLVPYLVGFLLVEAGHPLPYGELQHGLPGLLEEYSRYFMTQDRRQVHRYLLLLGMKKRLANKRPCPCAGGRRLGKCHNRMLTRLRTLASRSWFREHANYFGGYS